MVVRTTRFKKRLISQQRPTKNHRKQLHQKRKHRKRQHQKRKKNHRKRKRQKTLEFLGLAGSVKGLPNQKRLKSPKRLLKRPKELHFYLALYHFNQFVTYQMAWALQWFMRTTFVTVHWEVSRNQFYHLSNLPQFSQSK